MRFGRSIGWLLVLVSALAGALVATRWGRFVQMPEVGAQLFPVPMEMVTSMTWGAIDAKGHRETLEVHRDGMFWRMVHPYAGAICEAGKITDMLDAAESMRILAVLGKRETSAFEVERQLTLQTADMAVTCGFGEISPMRLSQTLAETGEWLVAVEAAAIAKLPENADALRTRAVFPVSPEQLVAFEWRTPGKPFARAQRMPNGNWNITRPIPFEKQAEQVAATLKTLTDPASIVRYVFPIAAEGDGVAAEGFSTAMLARYGLDEESATRVSAFIQGLGEPLVIRIGQVDPTSKGNRFCLLEGAQSVVSVPEAFVAVFGERGVFTTDFRQLPIFGDVAALRRVDVRRVGDASALVLEMRRHRWSLTSPVELPADAQLAKAAVETLCTMVGDWVAAEVPQNATPIYDFALTPEGTEQTIKFRVFELPESDRLGIFRQDVGRFYHVARTAIPTALMSKDAAWAMVDKTILSLPAARVRRMVVRYRDGEEIAITRQSPDGVWVVEYPVGLYVNETTVEMWLTAFAELRADQVLRELPTAFGVLHAYGIDTPYARITLDLAGVEDGLRRVLLLGTPDLETGEAPVLVQGRPVLYRISRELTQLLVRPLAEKEGTNE